MQFATDDTVVGKLETFALHYNTAAGTSTRSTPCADCGQPEHKHRVGVAIDACLAYRPESVTLTTAPRDTAQEKEIDVQRARDALKCMEHHRARIAAQRDLTRAQLIAQDAALAELDPLISLWKGIVDPHAP